MGDLIQFPKKVEIAQLFNEGLFGLSVNSIAKVNVFETSIMIWFVNDDDDRVWDLQLEYPTVEDAQASFDEMNKAIKKMRFKVIKDEFGKN